MGKMTYKRRKNVKKQSFKKINKVYIFIILELIRHLKLKYFAIIK